MGLYLPALLFAKSFDRVDDSSESYEATFHGTDGILLAAYHGGSQEEMLPSAV